MDTPVQASDGTKHRLLLVEDSESDAKLAIWHLREAGFRCSYRSVASEVEMRTALRSAQPDLILSDFSMPRFDGLSALAIARVEAPDVPFIFLSGTIGEKRAIEALKHGAIDYVLKSNPMRLMPAVLRALKDAQLRRKSHLAEQEGTRLTGVLLMLAAVNAAVARISSRDDLLPEICRLARNLGRYTIAMIALINPITRMARPVGWAGFDFLDEPQRQFPVASSDATDKNLMGRVIRTGRIALCDDIGLSLLPIDGRRALIAAGVNSLACLPLTVDNTPVGAFLVGALATGVMSQDELLLLEEVASKLSFALQHQLAQDWLRASASHDLRGVTLAVLLSAAEALCEPQ